MWRAFVFGAAAGRSFSVCTGVRVVFPWVHHGEEGFAADRACNTTSKLTGVKHLFVGEGRGCGPPLALDLQAAAAVE